MQDRPVCFQCNKPVETNAEMVFEAPCGHPDHSSAVFHGICLFDWRDRRASFADYAKKMRDQCMEEHGLTEIEEDET